MEEWKTIHIPYVYVKNFIDIRYHKYHGYDLWSGIMHFPNSEPMMMFSTMFSVKFHCEMEDTIVKFPFDKHSCILEVNSRPLELMKKVSLTQILECSFY